MEWNVLTFTSLQFYLCTLLSLIQNVSTKNLRVACEFYLDTGKGEYKKEKQEKEEERADPLLLPFLFHTLLVAFSSIKVKVGEN